MEDDIVWRGETACGDLPPHYIFHFNNLITTQFLLTLHKYNIAKALSEVTWQRNISGNMGVLRYSSACLRGCQGVNLLLLLWLFHPLSIPMHSYGLSWGSAGADPSSLWPKRRGKPWTGRQSITGPHVDKQPCTLTLIPMSNPELSLDCGRKLEDPEKIPKSPGKTYKLHT